MPEGAFSAGIKWPLLNEKLSRPDESAASRICWSPTENRFNEPSLLAHAHLPHLSHLKKSSCAVSRRRSCFVTEPPHAGHTMELSAKAAYGTIDKTKNAVKIIDNKRFFIDTTKRRIENDGTEQRTVKNCNMGNYWNVGNNDFLACWAYCKYKSNCMATVQNVPLSAPPVMAAFLIAYSRMFARSSRPGRGLSRPRKERFILFHLLNRNHRGGDKRL